MGKLNDLTRSHIKWFGAKQAEVRFGEDQFVSVALQKTRICHPHFIKSVFPLVGRLGKLKCDGMHSKCRRRDGTKFGGILGLLYNQNLFCCIVFN